MLKSSHTRTKTEAGCDEAGRGCLAGPVFAAAVILPRDYRSEGLRDSKKLSAGQREILRRQIEQDALAWNVAPVSNVIIDEINILNASILAMHQAIAGLKIRPDLLLIDGNRFHPFEDIPHICFVKGDDRYLSIAASSVLAKTHRDEHMAALHEQYPRYDWLSNKGYPTEAHRRAISKFGITPHHRLSFNLNEQLKLRF